MIGVTHVELFSFANEKMQTLVKSMPYNYVVLAIYNILARAVNQFKYLTAINRMIVHTLRAINCTLFIFS